MATGEPPEYYAQMAREFLARMSGGEGAGSVPPLPSASKLEAIEHLLANLFVMQVMSVARQDALFEILIAEGIITPEHLEAINRDVQDTLRDHTGGSIPDVE